MPDSGMDLGADLYRLHTMATSNLPDVAEVYRRAAARLVSTDSGLTAAFVRPAQFGGTRGPAYKPWVDLRDTIKGFLSDTGNNLGETAAALLLAVEAYSEVDHAAGVEFKELKRKHGA
jgi:hypothetical protein